MARNCIDKDVVLLSEKVAGKRKKNNSFLLLRMSPLKKKKNPTYNGKLPIKNSTMASEITVLASG